MHFVPLPLVTILMAVNARQFFPGLDSCESISTSMNIVIDPLDIELLSYIVVSLSVPSYNARITNYA